MGLEVTGAAEALVANLQKRDRGSLYCFLYETSDDSQLSTAYKKEARQQILGTLETWVCITEVEMEGEPP